MLLLLGLGATEPEEAGKILENEACFVAEKQLTNREKMMNKFMIVWLFMLAAILFGMVDLTMANFTNPLSSYSHTVDGYFTDWTSPPPAEYEWFDITPHVGQYSYVYFDYDGSKFYMMNDWFVNTQGMNATDYNGFTFALGVDSWDFRVYGDGSVTLLKNGAADPTAEGAYGFGPSPNLNTDHTMWEVATDITPDSTIIADVSDPKAPGELPVKDPKFLPGFEVYLDPAGGTTSKIIPAPGALILGSMGVGLVGWLRRRRRL